MVEIVNFWLIAVLKPRVSRRGCRLVVLGFGRRAKLKQRRGATKENERPGFPQKACLTKH
jgi:hypothetical protein